MTNAQDLRARGISIANIRQAMAGHPTWVQDDCITWAISTGWTFTGTEAVLAGFFHPGRKPMTTQIIDLADLSKGRAYAVCPICLEIISAEREGAGYRVTCGCKSVHATSSRIAVRAAN